MKPSETTPIDRALLMAFEVQEEKIKMLESEILAMTQENSKYYQRAASAEFELKAAIEKYERSIIAKDNAAKVWMAMVEEKKKEIESLQSELKSARHSIAVMKGRRKNA